jgi:LysR family transcriptional regulator, glycine cleavage system transcriptional activator
MKRTLLPLNGLRVFDAAARHLSFTRAADELAVTPAAVGQQIRALEDVLGVVLFRRTPKGLELTPEAQNGLDALRAGFLQFEEAVRAMQIGQSSKSLTIAAPRDMTAKWLAPRLADFGRTDPEIRFVIVAADEPPEFTEANLDVAIVFAEGPGEYEGVKLAEGAMVTVVAPEGAGDTLINWPGSDAEDTASLRVADAGLALDAAANGFGRAKVPLLLAESDIQLGRVRAIDNAHPCDRAYWLIAPRPQWRQKKVRALVEALLGAAIET